KLINGVEYAPAFLSETEYALKSLIIYALWTGISGNFILYCGAMNRIPIEVVESARLEGSMCWTELVHIVIPMIWPTLSTTLIFTVVGIFSSSGNILLLTHGVTSTYTLSYWIFDQVRTFQSYYVPSALGLVFTLIGFPIVLITRYFLNKIYPDVEY
ncbi:MAG: carbohydrate ABC transporter permease, partial [Candidatus Scatosoma sp.]